MSRTLNDETTADTVLQPPDTETCFYVHKDVLAAYSSVFATARECSAHDPTRGVQIAIDPTSSHPGFDVVSVTESASTLENLLRFMYRDQVQPDLHTLEFEELARLAEAVENLYDVYSIKQLMGFAMSERIKERPFEVFAYATTHGYELVAIDAAVWGLGHPKSFKSPEMALSGGDSLSRWHVMRETILSTNTLVKDLDFRSTSSLEPANTYLADHDFMLEYSYHPDDELTRRGKFKCPSWSNFHTSLHKAVEATAPYTSHLDIPSLFENEITANLEHCECCIQAARKWLSEFLERRRAALRAKYVEANATSEGGD